MVVVEGAHSGGEDAVEILIPKDIVLVGISACTTTATLPSMFLICYLKSKVRVTIFPAS
jgi:hypothetical protein